jgi:hypothetical protein
MVFAKSCWNFQNFDGLSGWKENLISQWKPNNIGNIKITNIAQIP